MKQFQSESLCDYGDGDFAYENGKYIADFYSKGRNSNGHDVYEVEVTSDSETSCNDLINDALRCVDRELIDKSFRMEDGVQIITVWTRRRATESLSA